MKMRETRWQKIETIVDRALQLPQKKRNNFLNTECGNDKKLKDEVTALLESIRDAKGWLENPLDYLYGNIYSDTINNANNLADAYLDNNMPDSALFYNTLAFKNFSRLDKVDKDLKGNILQDRANIQNTMAHFKLADSLYQQAVDIFENVYGSMHPTLAYTYRRWAENALANNKPSKGYRLFTKAFQIKKKTSGVKAGETQMVLSQLIEAGKEAGMTQKTDSLSLLMVSDDRN